VIGFYHCSCTKHLRKSIFVFHKGTLFSTLLIVDDKEEQGSNQKGRKQGQLKDSGTVSLSSRSLLHVLHKAEGINHQ
jgi:hypothetical protein